MAKFSRKNWIWIGLLIFVIAICGWIFWPQSPTPTPEETPTTKATSTFTLISYVDGEDVSNFAEMDIWEPKTDATFDEGYEDITAITTKFEKAVTGKDADDISIDLRDEDYYWAEVTGNSVWDNTFYLLIGGANYDYLFYVHHTSSDVNFNVLDDSMNELNYGIDPTVTPASGQKGVDANYTAVLKAPHLTKTNCHYGDVGWVMTATDFSELTLKNKEIIWNENDWRDQWPTYDPTLDTSNDFVRDFEIITNAFGLKWTMNESISVVDGNALQINCTIGKGYPVEAFISGVYLYMIWYEGFDFDPSPYAMEFELSFGSAINVTTVQSGRVTIPSTTVTGFTAYSTIGA